VSRPTLGPIQPPIQWVPGPLSRGIKRPGREADHSPPSSAEIKIRGAILVPPSQYVFMAWCLFRDRDNFTLLYLIVILWTILKLFFHCKSKLLKNSTVA
jgi:hypothetical protein